MMNSDYSKELQIAQKAASEASEVIKQYAGNREFEVSYKGKNDLVTEADIETEKTILNRISETYPDDQIMAEETLKGKKVPEKRTWLIDPIDGTTNFAHGFPVYCTSIALWEEGEAKVGVVLEINRTELFHAIRGEGAWLNNNLIQTSTISELSASMVGTGFPYSDLSLIKNYLNFFEWLMHNTHGVRRPGAAAYDLCCLAAGRYDGFYEYGLSAWDVGAASLLVREAGGVITDWTGGDNWLFGRRIVAGNPDIHPKLLEAIQNNFTGEELDGVVGLES